MHDDTGRLPGRRETDFEEGRPPPGDCTEDGRRRVKHRELLNLLNFVNFSEGTIFVSFSPREPGESIFLQAAPRLCQDEVLCCRWLSPGISPGRMNSHTCDSFLISDGHNEVSVKAEVLHLDAEGISFKIPESGYEKSHRRVRRHSCAGIEARLTQTGLGFDGRLLDFNALSFRVEVCAPPDGSLRWINPAVPLTALFYGDGKLLYSGECLILRMDGGPDRRSLVLSPNFNNISRRRPKEFRSERHVLSPAPAVSFVHPFTGTAVHLQAKNISGAGLCVEEFLENSSLLPGMIIPEISIEIANRLMLRCRAQVLYRNVIGNGDRFAVARCGITMLDMDIRDQAAFSALLHQSIDDRMHVCGPVDLEELWRFFFESGFIYPSKYLAIEAHKQEFRRTYEKLYRDSPSIGRHFIFQDRGRIFGHMSMIRCHSNSWLIHHHAASRDGYGMAGVEVLNQAGRYCNDFHSYPETHMDYLMCYFRRENRFPARVFGNIARDIGDPKGSSLDDFAYLHLPEDPGVDSPAFQLFPAGVDDFAALRRRYEDVSGGLLIDALDLQAVEGPDLALSAEYAAQGFKRERHVFGLKQEGRLGAVIMLTLSDLGLNLSNLTNCAHVFVIDEERLRPATLFAGLRAILGHYAAEEVPILAFPVNYLERLAIPYEKKYNLWVVSLEHSDGYFRSLRTTFRRTSGERDDEQRCHG